eukprot:Skav231390  [mRNA]  locus=scaffold7522:6388:9329:+ [translate_table: standard]
MSARGDALLAGVAAASKLHKQLSVRSQLQSGATNVDVFGAIHELGIPLLLRPLDKLLGACVVSGGVVGIIVTTQRDLHMQRFTAAHELGHVILAHDLRVDNPGDVGHPGTGQSRPPEEHGADAFAAEFLMPKWLIAHHAKRHGWWSQARLGDPSVVYQLSLRMSVSYEALVWSLQNHKIVSAADADSLRDTKPKASKSHVLQGSKLDDPWADAWLLGHGDHGSTLLAGPTDQFVLPLQERGAAGYLWELDRFPEDLLRVVEDRRQPGEGKAIADADGDKRADHAVDYNLAMVAPSATAEGKRDSAIRESVDALLQENGKFSLREVAETIFPAGEWCRHGARGVYEDYPDQCYPILKTRWGTYAHRLVRRPNGKGGEENPLKQCIDKMRGELASSGPKRACYELPLYDPLTDAKTRMGGPCLMHVSLKVTRSREVNLTAVYRSQYYVERALGNMWGLALLQNFVAEEVRKMDFDEYQAKALETDQVAALSDKADAGDRSQLVPLLGMTGEVGALLSEYKKYLRDGPGHTRFPEQLSEELGDVLWYVSNVASKFGLSLGTIASANLEKTQGRWGKGGYVLYDHAFPVEEQLPRQFAYEFSYVEHEGKTKVVLRDTDGRQIGDPLTDNARHDDGYRFHDVLHLANAAVLGWSECSRAWVVPSCSQAAIPKAAQSRRL